MVITLLYNLNILAFNSCWRIGEQRSTSRSLCDWLTAYCFSIDLRWFKETKGDPLLALFQHVERETHGGLGRHIETGIRLNANGDERRIELCLRDPVYGCRTDIPVVGLRGHHVDAVGDHAERGFLLFFFHLMVLPNRFAMLSISHFIHDGKDSDMSQTRPPHLRRSWLFVGGANEAELIAAADSGADVLIHELEDFTSPALRPKAREVSRIVLSAWKALGVVAGVRINPLAGCGHEDLAAVMRGAPDVVMLPKVSDPSNLADLDKAVSSAEHARGLKFGSTELVPNIELARGLIRTYDVCKVSPRVRSALVASEDMATDLGAERGSDGEELKYVRARFHVECTAAGVVSIDAPYTWTDDAGIKRETLYARRLGYRAKSAVNPAHPAIINSILTPSVEEIEQAQRIFDAFEAAQVRGEQRIELDGSLVEMPTYRNAEQLLKRAEELGVL